MVALQPTQLALVGEYNEQHLAHQAIDQTFQLAASLFPHLSAQWLPTIQVEQLSEAELASYDGFWCVPGSPYESTDGALRAIRFAREHRRPFFGSCGGFQHAILEFARHQLGIRDAEHYEINAVSGEHVIVPLTCSLVEKQDTVFLEAGSRMAAFCGTEELREGYHCNYGIAEGYRQLLEEHGLHICGSDAQGEARAFELREHPFFFGTLFQPERASLKGSIHPLLKAFLQVISDN